MSDTTLSIKLTTEGGKVIVKDFTDISDAAHDAGKSLDRTDAASEKASKSIKKTGTSAKRAAADIDTASTSVTGMANQLKLLVGVVSFSLLSKEVKDYADTWKLANNQLALVTDTERELITVREELLATARDTNTELLGTIELYASFERGTRELGFAQASVIDITETMNNLLLAGGKAASVTSGAIRQLNQGLESGALRGDEFNSVAEGAPRVLDALSLSLGISRGALRDFAATGGITSEILATALLAYQSTAQGMADATERTFDQQLNNAKTNIIEFVGESQLLNAAVSSTGSGLVLLTENIDSLAYGVGAAGAVYAASFIPSIASSIATQYQAAVAAQQSTVAQVAKAKALVASAVSATNAAKSEVTLASANVAGIQSVIGQLEAEAALETVRLKAQITDRGRILTASRMAEIQLARTAIVKQLTAAEANLSLMGQRAAAMSGIQATTTAGLATAQTAATRTSYALGVATRFLLGPYGLLLAAVGAATTAFYLSAEASEADEKAKTKQAEANEKLLKTFDAMRTNRPSDFSDAYIETQQAQIEIDTKLIVLKEKLKTLTEATQFAPGANIGKKSALSKEINELTAAQLTNAQSLKAMKLAYDKGIPSIENMVEPAKEVVAFTNDINDELNALIDTLNPASAALRQYGEDYDVLLGAYVDGFITYERHIALIALLDAQFAKQSEKMDDVTDKNALYVASLEAQLSIGRLVGKDLVVETALRKLSADATEKQREEVKKLAVELYNQKAATEAMDLSGLTSQVDDYGTAWGNVGNTIVDAFGSIGAQLDQFAEQQDSYAQSLEDFAARRALINSSDDISSEAKAKSLKELAGLEDKLTEQNVKNQLSAFGSILGGASELFDEQSKAREILHKGEQLFTAIEIGLALKKASANALTAITTQGQGDPYTAFGRIAAMAALMAGLGVFAGSVSGADIASSESIQQSQGTGTVFGDAGAKSESIANSSERFEDLAIDQLAELVGIRQNTRDLTSSIENLAQSFVSGLDFGDSGYNGSLGTSGRIKTDFEKVGENLGGFLGDPLGQLVDGLIGSFKGTKKELLDSGITFAAQSLADVLTQGLDAQIYQTIKTTKKSWWGLVKNENTEREFSEIDSAITQQMSTIYGYLGTSVLDAAQLLGFETVEQIKSQFVGPLQGADLEEIRKGLAGSFANTFNVVEVELEEALNNFQIDLPEISFKDLSGEEIQAELEAIFSQQGDLIAQYLVPSISNYQKIGEGAYETLLRVAQEQVIVNDHFDRMGIVLGGLSKIELIDVAQNVINLVGGLEAFQEASNTFFTEFYSDVEQFEYLQKSLTEVMATMNLSLPDSRDGFRELALSFDTTTDEGQRLFATLLQISGSAAEYYDALEDGILTTDAATESIAARIGIEKSWAEQIVLLGLDATQTQLRVLENWYAEQITIAEEAGASTVLLERLYATKRTTILDDATQAINDNTASALAALTDEHNTAVGAITADYQAMFDVISGLSAVINESVLTVNRAASSWDEVNYQIQKIAELSSQIGQGDVSQQSSTIEQLIGAVMARFQAEMDVNNQAISETEQLVSEHTNAVDQLTTDYQAMFGVIESLSVAINANLLTIERSAAGWDEVAYQIQKVSDLTNQLGQGDISQQSNTIEQLIGVVMSRFQAEMNVNNQSVSDTQKLVSDHENAVSSLASTYEQLFSSINSVSNSVSSGMLSIQRAQAGFSEIDYQSNQIANLQGQLGQGDIAAQAGTVQGLVDATLAKYGAQINDAKLQVDALNAAENERYRYEMDHYNDLVNAANSKYQSELAQYESLKKAADNLKATADSLLIGDLSYLSAGDQRSEAQSQYDNLLARAQSGDADAASELNNFSKQFLDINKEYLGGTGSSEFGELFDQVQSDLRGFNVGSAPSRQALPAAPREVVQYQVDNLAIQANALNELAALQTLLDDLNTQATEQQKTESETLNAQLEVLNATLLTQQEYSDELAANAVIELTQLQSLVSDLNAQAVEQQKTESETLNAQVVELNTQLEALNATLLAQQEYSDELAANAVIELTHLQSLVSELNKQTIIEQTASLDSLKVAFDQSVAGIWAQESEQLLALKASQELNSQAEVDAIYDASLAIVNAVNAIDVTPVVIAPPDPVATNTSKQPAGLVPETYPGLTILDASTKEQTVVIERLHVELKKQSESQKKQQIALDKLGREFVKISDTKFKGARIA
jgi:tape measure domain-containing protein